MGGVSRFTGQERLMLIIDDMQMNSKEYYAQWEKRKEKAAKLGKALAAKVNDLNK